MKKLYVDSPTGKVEVVYNVTPVRVRDEDRVTPQDRDLATIVRPIEGIEGGVVLSRKIYGLKNWNLDALTLWFPTLEDLTRDMFGAEAESNRYLEEAEVAADHASKIDSEIRKLQARLETARDNERFCRSEARESAEKAKALKDQIKKFYFSKA